MAAAPVEESTVAFEETMAFEDVGSEPIVEAPVAPPVAPPVVAPPVVPAAEIPAAPAAAVAVPEMSEEQLRAAILGASRDVIERIVWEVVPDLAEVMIREAIEKIKRGE
jgi:hypothetical protein